MSRRKQSNPKPLKWEECWNEAEDGESRVGSKLPADATSPPTRDDSGPESSSSTQKLKERERARSLRLTSGCSSEIEITRIRQKSGGESDPNANARNWPTKTSGHGKYGGRVSASPAEMDQEDSNREIMLRRRHDSQSRSHSPDIPGSTSESNGSPGPFSHHQILQAGLSYLHMLPPAIRNDASRYFMPHMIPPELTGTSPTPPGNSQQQSSQAKTEKVATSSEAPRSGPVFLCEPCGIKFSSARTLEAHQTYYCSFRKDTGKDGESKSSSVGPDAHKSTDSDSIVLGIKRERESSGEERELLIDESADPNLGQSNLASAKNIKTGKLYTCVYCSYSADKKVSLNRHMRMHSGVSMPNSNQPNAPTPTPLQHLPGNSNPGDDITGSGSPSLSSSGKNTNGSDVTAVERYCQDCDIQFSSIKTFRVHKQYYCSTRHVLKTQLAATATGAKPIGSGGVDMSNCSGGSVTPGPRKGSGSPEGRSPTPGPPTPIPPNQPFLVLPTNPVIIVPYCFIQGASILPGNVLPNQNAIVVLPNGAVQGLPATPVMIPSPSHSLGAAAAAMLIQHHANPFSNGGNNNSLTLPMATSGGVRTSELSPSAATQLTLSSSVFNDPKDIIRRIGGKGGRNPSESDHSQRSSSRSQSEKDGDCCPELEICSQSAPAIDLTLSRGDDEKENRELMSGIASRRVRSLTPEFSSHELNSPNSGRNSVGSGKSLERTPRPSSASMSSSCSSPPPHPYSDTMHSNPTGHKLPNGVKVSSSSYGERVSGKIGSSTASSSSIRQQQHQQQFASPNSKAFNQSKLDYNFNSQIQDKMSGAIATQLPGGAILTSTNNQSLAELLMSNPPELNESLAKLNSQLVMNSAAVAAAAGGFTLPPPGMFPPELAMRLMDPNYLAALQHSFQQQQQRQQIQNQKAGPTTAQLQQQPQTAPPKRGVSKCVDCDIVFYKYENYLVHKERYCAARESLKENQGQGQENSSGQPGVNPVAAKESISSNSSTKSEGEGDGSQCLSPPTHQGLQTRRSRSSQYPQGVGVNSSRSILRKSTESGGDLAACIPPTNKLSAKANTLSPPSPANAQTPSHPCLKCGVKYSTYDNLQTHQTFYCNKRNAVEPARSPKISNGGENLAMLKGEPGFLSCGKCKLAIPEEQMNLHAGVCQQGGGNGNSSALTTTSSVPPNLGWKCPCCETYSPTMSAAQKHLETHTGIRAFKCLLCGYRGNTLRGMRTHIRMHFDKRVSDLQEGDYIACITSKDLEGTQQQPTGNANVLSSAAANAAAHAVPTPLAEVKLERESQAGIGGTTAGVNNSPPSSHSHQSPPASPQQLSPTTGEMTPTIRQVENNNRLHFCQLCNYSSSYKGNVVRHMKLVHKISEELTEGESGGLLEERNGDPEDSSGSFGSRGRSPDHGMEISANHHQGSLLANNTTTVKLEKRSSSRLSGSQVGEILTGKERESSPPPTSNQIKKEKTCPPGKYCKPCDEYFPYLPTFIAHKKLYCPTSGHGRGVGTDAENIEQIQRERAETPVQ